MRERSAVDAHLSDIRARNAHGQVRHANRQIEIDLVGVHGHLRHLASAGVVRDLAARAPLRALPPWIALAEPSDHRLEGVEPTTVVVVESVESLPVAAQHRGVSRVDHRGEPAPLQVCRDVPVHVHLSVTRPRSRVVSHARDDLTHRRTRRAIGIPDRGLHRAVARHALEKHGRVQPRHTPNGDTQYLRVELDRVPESTGGGHALRCEAHIGQDFARQGDVVGDPLLLIHRQVVPSVLFPQVGVDRLERVQVHHERVRHHLGRDVEVRDDQLPAHLQPALLLVLAEERQSLIDPTQRRGAGHHAVLAFHPALDAELRELTRERLGVDHRHVLPAASLPVDRVAVSHPEVVQINEHRRIVEDDRERNPIQCVPSDLNLHAWIDSLSEDCGIWPCGRPGRLESGYPRGLRVNACLLIACPDAQASRGHPSGRQEVFLSPEPSSHSRQRSQRTEASPCCFRVFRA